MNDFSHIRKDKTAVMVDISRKKKTLRKAIASAEIFFSKDTYNKLKKNGSQKGEVISTARIAGIQASKKTSELIPLCHNIKIDKTAVEFSFNDESNKIIIEATVKTNEKTGVEMEALTVASISALTIYDMCKSIDKKILIKNIKLKFKSGGKSGIFKND